MMVIITHQPSTPACMCVQELSCSHSCGLCASQPAAACSYTSHKHTTHQSTLFVVDACKSLICVTISMSCASINQSVNQTSCCRTRLCGCTQAAVRQQPLPIRQQPQPPTHRVAQTLLASSVQEGGGNRVVVLLCVQLAIAQCVD